MRKDRQTHSRGEGPTGPAAPASLSCLFEAAKIFFMLQSEKKGQLNSRFLCFSARPRPSPNQAVLADILGGAGARVRDFQHYVRS